MDVKGLLAQVDRDRLAQLTLDLVKIPSPTGSSEQAAGFYADYLGDLGMQVEMVREFPGSPDVVGRYRGAQAGRTLEFNGHLDTIPVPVSCPTEIRDGRVYGRGAADMKCGLAAIAEAVRVLIGARLPLRGELLVVAHALHEAPGGVGEDLSLLVRQGITGDAVIVAEAGGDDLPIIGKGMSIYEMTIRREGEATHELMTAPSVPHPILLGHRILGAIEDKVAELARVDIPYVGPESFFVGIFQGGDFYNRVPTSCRIVGTRRYSPEKTIDDVRAELEGIIGRTTAGTGATVDLKLQRVRDGFRLSEDDEIVRIVRDSYQEVTGRPLPLSGINGVGDVSIFVKEGGVPAVYHGADTSAAHSDFESVPIDSIVRAARVYILSALKYLG